MIATFSADIYRCEIFDIVYMYAVENNAQYKIPGQKPSVWGNQVALLSVTARQNIISVQVRNIGTMVGTI